MATKIHTGVKQMVAEANEKIECLSAEQVIALLDDPDVEIVDIRDVREVQRDGRIPGSIHAPRGMLEFWVDPESPYHKEVFASGKKFIFHCASGWRSALATLAVQQMGLQPVAHIKTGFTGWKEAGGPVEAYEK